VQARINILDTYPPLLIVTVFESESKSLDIDSGSYRKRFVGEKTKEYGVILIVCS
jgi:hypothetical protein